MSSSPTISAEPNVFTELGGLTERKNIASELRARSAESPGRAAIRVPAGRGRWRDSTYAELEQRSDHIAAGLAAAGLGRGDRTCVFVRPGVELIALTYGLFKLGAVPVLIDPGMGRKSLLTCIERVAPRAFVGIPAAQVARLVFSRAFRSVELFVTVGRKLGWSGPTLERLVRGAASTPGPFEIADTAAGDPAAVLFTSGSTGPPKGVVYTHAMFEAQRRALSRLYTFRAGEVDVACFPLFALFDTALGMTSVFPELDPSRPGSCSPERVAAALEETGATLTFGSPAIWRRVAPWCRERGLGFEGLTRVLVAGAPVPPALVEELRAILPRGEVYTPYGATESLPVASISGSEILGPLRERSEGGAGTPVGRPAPGIDLRVLPIRDGAVAEFDPQLELAPGELGEICVRGPVVTQEYLFEPEQTAAAKLAHPGGGPAWHRMGDMGYRDGSGRLWFCGRVSHRLETAQGTLPPVPTENVFNTAAGVRRTALVGVGAPGQQRPVLVVELEGALPRGAAAEARAEELLRHGAERAAPVRPERVLFHGGFPVDVRHNAKIHRGELARWAEGRGA